MLADRYLGSLCLHSSCISEVELKDTTQASKDRMGKLNNALIQALDENGISSLETIAVLKLLLARLERAFEISMMPKRTEGKK